MLALEKPHSGNSGVPFMKSTTGADETALSIAARVSADKNRICRAASPGWANGLAGPATCRSTYDC